MKSVTIKDPAEKLLIKIIHRKSGVYEIIQAESLANLIVDVRDDQNCKVDFNEKPRPKPGLIEV